MRIPATDRPWRDLPDDVRADIAARAARSQPALAAEGALAAVSRGRAHGRRAQRAIKWTLGAAMVLMVGGIVESAAMFPVVPGFTRHASIGFFLVPMVLVMAVGVVYALFGTLRGYVLVRPNLALAATVPTPADRTLRIGSRHPLIGFVGVASLMVGALALAIVDREFRFVALLPVLAGAGAIWFGPGAGAYAHATIDDTGITLPIMRLRIPWSAVGAMEITAPNRVTVAVDRYEITGWLPARWRRLAEPNIRPVLRLTTPYPEEVVTFGRPPASSHRDVSTSR